MLRMGEELLDLWKIGYYDTSAVDYTNGIRVPYLFQRKSKDSATCFGNTLIAMLAISRCMDMEKVICGYFVGDDSVVYFAKVSESDSIVKRLSEIFNLSTKLIDNEIGYMCSNFLISCEKGVYKYRSQLNALND